tara:strand:+ start:297 stop:497 length:201 start_codon:yes stop_codon:yes gene_type:complete
MDKITKSKNLAKEPEPEQHAHTPGRPSQLGQSSLRKVVAERKASASSKNSSYLLGLKKQYKKPFLQ